MIFAEDLSVLHDDNGTFIDNSKEALDYGRDSFVLDLVSANDFLYVGLYKPFKNIYAEMKVLNTNANTLTAEYWDGTSWSSLDNFFDMSRGMTRSGFITWTKNTAWAKTSVNGDSMYWVRFKPSSDFLNTTEVQGLNIVFADDQDLKNEFSSISAYLTNLSLLSYITYHQSVRDDIIQELRNKGQAKISSSSLSNITKWDILDVEELKRASVYGCLAKIFFELSDNIEDKWYQRYQDYYNKRNSAIELMFLSLDKNDDGIKQVNESVVYQSTRLIRQ